MSIYTPSVWVSVIIHLLDSDYISMSTMASIFTVGKTFSDYQTLEKEVEKFKKENFVRMTVRK